MSPSRLAQPSSQRTKYLQRDFKSAKQHLARNSLLSRVDHYISSVNSTATAIFSRNIDFIWFIKKYYLLFEPLSYSATTTKCIKNGEPDIVLGGEEFDFKRMNTYRKILYVWWEKKRAASPTNLMPYLLSHHLECAWILFLRASPVQLFYKNAFIHMHKCHGNNSLFPPVKRLFFFPINDIYIKEIS